MSRGLDLWQWDSDGVAATGERGAAALGRRAGRLHGGLDERVPFAAVGAAAEELGALVAALLTDELGVGLGHLKPRTRNFRALLWGISPQRTRRRNGGGTEEVRRETRTNTEEWRERRITEDARPETNSSGWVKKRGLDAAKAESTLPVPSF